MRRWLLEIIACPACRTYPLECEVEKEDNNEIIEGKLICRRCDASYEIREGIPRMLRDELLKNDVDDGVLEGHKKVRDANISYHDSCADLYEEDISTACLFTEFNQSRIENRIRNLSQEGDDLCFLDIGCGTGNCLKWGSSYYEQAVGIDVSLNMLKIAKDRNFDVIQADALFLPFISNTFSAVTSISFLHHVYSHNPILKEIDRILKNGGYYYSEWDPNKMFTKKLDRWFPGRLRAIILPIILATTDSKPTYKRAEITDPSTSEIHKLAEYYQFSDDPGIDPTLIVDCLRGLGFNETEILYHWMGRQLDQLPFLQRLMASVFIGINSPNNDIAPHFSIVAKKG